ncbi:MAG TPA: tetratricopeptide repeat protein [Thermoanaerobaculia bacterium]|nr:tetratricopeptide repeat protein [Thermoanaerobaculia bacterium]
MPEPAVVYDVFLSHGSPDKPWVETLDAELRALGLKPFLDRTEIGPGESFPEVLSRGLADSRFLVLVLSPRSSRAWVNQEWQAFLAHHGPQGRLLPVLLEPTEIPALLASIQEVDALDRDAARVAREIALLAGRPSELRVGDTRRLVVGQDLVFNLAWEAEKKNLRVVDPVGRVRTVQAPWEVDKRFGVARLIFNRLSHEPVTSEKDRADLVRHASTLGGLLFDLLFDAEGLERLRAAMVPGRPRPLITIRSDDDLLLSLPWELLWHNGSFLLRDARLDLARSTPGKVGPGALLREPEAYLKLVVNVSAPEGSGLDYEGESYRITKALSEQCRFVPTELGTVDDLAATVRKERPTVLHFSGHGAPGALAFEDDEGREVVVSIHDLLQTLRAQVDGPLPPLFYLASCYGNDPAAPGAPGAPQPASPEEGKSGAESSAARLHREGVPQVAGYYGPIVDALSTRAEVAFYRALAEGETTRYAVRQARAALAQPFGDPEARHRPRALAPTTGPAETAQAGAAAGAEAFAQSTHPFAWAQLVLYHRGPDHPLSLAAAAGLRPAEEALKRTFEGAGDRRVLTTGFIGRRRELHKVRRRIREGERVFVFQGLGGLGKSTLALHVLPMLRGSQGEVVILWCQEVEQQANRAEGLVGQLLDFCRKKFGLGWEQVVQQVDRAAGNDPVQRFSYFLQALLQNLPRLVIYLDNLESLLAGPKEAEAGDDDTAFGEWANDEVRQLWEVLTTLARDGDRLFVVASCRYRNPSFAGSLLPVSPLPPDALYRLMGWFPALRRLGTANRARLVGRLAGHPRAAEYANDLLAHALADWEDHHGPWEGGESAEHEWAALVEPVLPKVRDKLQANLLLAEIWDRVLADGARRMLYRMTLLRRPWEWSLMAVLGEEAETDEAAFATAERLRRTSLLEQVELLVHAGEGKVAAVRHYTLHPATAQFVRERFADDETLLTPAHRRLGERLEVEAKTSPFIDVDLEAGHHLFQAGEYDRAYELLGPAADWLREHGRAREGLRVLETLLDEPVQAAMAPEQVGRLLGTVGMAHGDLGEVRQAIGYYEQALLIHREIGNRRGEGSGLGNLGLAYAELGEVEKAIGYYEQALVISREIGNRRGEGNALGNLGLAYADLGEVEKAIGYYEQQLVIVREIGDRRGEGNALGNLGGAYYLLGEVEKAIGYYEQTLVIHREIGNRRGEGGSLGNLGLAYASLGKVENAIASLEQALAIGRAIKDPQIIRVCSETLEKLRGAEQG